GGNALADLERFFRLLARLERRAGDRHQRPAGDVVDDLRGDVLERTEHHETRTPRRSSNFFANAEMAPMALLLACLRNHWHGYLPPALPALRRMTSPAYLMPLPLYGSGGRRPRSSAATCPTFSLSAPSITIVVGCGALSFTPAGALYWIGCEKSSASWSPNGFTSAL